MIGGSVARLAWRNLGRNRRRTLITGVAITVGITLSVAAYGLIDGMNMSLLDALTRFDLGHVQVHQKDFLRTRSLKDTIDDPARVLAAARAISGVRGASPRVYGYALLSHGDHSGGAELVGVDPRTEPRVTTLDTRLVAGSYLDRAPTPWPKGRALTAAEKHEDRQITHDEETAAIDEIDSLAPMSKAAGQRAKKAAGKTADTATRSDKKSAGGAPATSRVPGASPAPFDPARAAALTRKLATQQAPQPKRPPHVIIGDALAKVLGVGVGDRIHATGQTVDGLSGDIFLRVAGIYHTGTHLLDRSRVYMHIADLQRFIHLDGRVHEIAIRTADPDDAGRVASVLAATLHAPALSVEGWRQLRPDIAQIIHMESSSAVIMVFIILFVATLGVVNTMLMSVFERTRELGVLKAIGMSGGRIVALIVAETTLLALAASLAGTLLGGALDLYMAHHGVDLTAFTKGVSMGGVGINPVIHGAIELHGLVLPTAVLVATSFVASFYPAARAARMRPAAGMRET